MGRRSSREENSCRSKQSFTHKKVKSRRTQPSEPALVLCSKGVLRQIAVLALLGRTLAHFINLDTDMAILAFPCKTLLHNHAFVHFQKVLPDAQSTHSPQFNERTSSACGSRNLHKINVFDIRQRKNKIMQRERTTCGSERSAGVAGDQTAPRRKGATPVIKEWEVTCAGHSLTKGIRHHSKKIGSQDWGSLPISANPKNVGQVKTLQKHQKYEISSELSALLKGFKPYVKGLNAWEREKRCYNPTQMQHSVLCDSSLNPNLKS